MPSKKTATKKTPSRPKHWGDSRVGNTPLTFAEVECLHLSMGKATPEEAAAIVGLPPGAGDTLWKSKRGRDYVNSYRRVVMIELARREADELTSHDINRTSLIKLSWKYANLGPERTRGTIDGQIKAIERISTMLGLDWTPRDISNALDGLTDEELEEFAKSGNMPAKPAAEV